MSKVGVKYVALILFVGAAVAYVFGFPSKSTIPNEVGPTWTWLDYSALVMLMAAIGCSIAAYKLPDYHDEGKDI